MSDEPIVVRGTGIAKDGGKDGILEVGGLRAKRIGLIESEVEEGIRVRDLRVVLRWVKLLTGRRS